MPPTFELAPDSIGVAQQRRYILPDRRVEPLHPDRRVLADPHATPAKSVGPRAEVIAVRAPVACRFHVVLNLTDISISTLGTRREALEQEPHAGLAPAAPGLVL